MEHASGKRRIYLTAFPHIRPGWLAGVALAEDGEGLASRWSRSVAIVEHDLGLTSTWQHDVYFAHYPDGFELVWVEDPNRDPRWLAALNLNLQRFTGPDSASMVE